LVRETAVILLSATLLGFAYTFVTKKGFFAEKPVTPAALNIQMCLLEEAKQLYDSRTAVFIDARHEFEFKLGHIRGAYNIALKEFDAHKQRLASIPKETLIVIYCDGAECNSSIEVGIKLSALGYSKIKVFFGGWQEWSANNLPIDK
jgi:rhodanese-related sulfurtransferase